jgi:hypothetical protein
LIRSRVPARFIAIPPHVERADSRVDCVNSSPPRPDHDHLTRGMTVSRGGYAEAVTPLAHVVEALEALGRKPRMVT